MHPRTHANQVDPETGASRGLRILLASAVGHGQTSLSAFDDALWGVGVHNYNILQLSSVIPPRSEVVLIDRFEAPACEFGHKLFVVKAEARSTTPGDVIAAGVGWHQWGEGQGVFVEHDVELHGGSTDGARATLEAHIDQSLRDLADRRGVAFDPARSGTLVSVTEVGATPACVLVLAIYESEGWRAAAGD